MNNAPIVYRRKQHDEVEGSSREPPSKSPTAQPRLRKRRLLIKLGNFIFLVMKQVILRGLK